jgi:hypothetical protein
MSVLLVMAFRMINALAWSNEETDLFLSARSDCHYKYDLTGQ